MFANKRFKVNTRNDTSQTGYLAVHKKFTHKNLCLISVQIYVCQNLYLLKIIKSSHSLNLQNYNGQNAHLENHSI